MHGQTWYCTITQSTVVHILATHICKVKKLSFSPPVFVLVFNYVRIPLLVVPRSEYLLLCFENGFLFVIKHLTVRRYGQKDTYENPW